MTKTKTAKDQTKKRTRKRSSRTSSDNYKGPVTEKSYIRSGSKSQLKLLTTLQGRLRKAGSRHSVVPVLSVLSEIENLRVRMREHQGQIDTLEKAIKWAEGQSAYKTAAKEEETSMKWVSSDAHNSVSDSEINFDTSTASSSS